jgi:hypothetical protein
VVHDTSVKSGDMIPSRTSYWGNDDCKSLPQISRLMVVTELAFLASSKFWCSECDFNRGVWSFDAVRNMTRIRNLITCLIQQLLTFFTITGWLRFNLEVSLRRERRGSMHKANSHLLTWCLQNLEYFQTIVFITVREVSK